MADQSPATYGLLGMLAVRSWTGYELTRQVRRSLRFIWPTSEGHLYREQKRLVTLGWAVVEQEQNGRRVRNRYTITQAGREALARWLATPPEEPHLQIEGVLRAFYANLGDPADLHQSMTTTAEQAGSMLATLRGFVREYLAEGGPMDMLEQGIGGPGERRTFAGRTHEQMAGNDVVDASSVAASMIAIVAATGRGPSSMVVGGGTESSSLSSFSASKTAPAP